MMNQTIIRNVGENKKALKIPHMVIVRAPGLLPMKYTIDEISHELEVPHSTLIGWINHGMPIERDSNNQIWINGEQFAGWVKSQKALSERYKLGDNEGLCLRCNRVVVLQNPKMIKVEGKLIHFKGNCQIYGSTIVGGGKIG